MVVNELLMKAADRIGSGDPTPMSQVSMSLGRSGRVAIAVREAGKKVTSPGTGERAKPLGKLLVETLTSQLEGTIEFSGDQGNEAVLRFPSALFGAQNAQTPTTFPSASVI
jgi:two-component sensor histidine kinase